jgi:hypothetical protein
VRLLQDAGVEVLQVDDADAAAVAAQANAHLTRPTDAHDAAKPGTDDPVPGSA